MARPMPREAPVTIAARSGMRGNLRWGPWVCRSPCSSPCWRSSSRSVSLTDSDEPEAPEQTSIATIAERVESLRKLRFDELPEPVSVTGEEAAQEGIDALDRDYPAAQRAADEKLYIMLGLLPEGTDLREEATSIFGEQVAGYYDPKTKRLRLVEGAAGSRVSNEMIIAHELNHALEDQAIGLDLDELSGSGDSTLAVSALAEGSATVVMYGYLDKYFGAEEALGGLLSDSLNAPSTANLPPFLVAQLLFPYTAGQQFVTVLLQRDDTWGPVDEALRERPPESTEQILHPEKWFDHEAPIDVTLPPPPRRLQEGLERRLRRVADRAGCCA